MTGLPGDARERLARWLADEDAESRGAEPYSDMSWACVRGRWLSKADHLLPVVTELADLRAAEELRAAADDPAICFITASPSFGLPVRVVNVSNLYARAAALTPTAEGDPQ